MKKYFWIFFGFIFSLFLGTNALSADYLVIGAGTTGVNGIYAYNSTDDMWDFYNGGDRYSMYYLGCDGDWRRKWMIVPPEYHTINSDNHWNLYTTIYGDSTELLPVNGWHTNPRGYSVRGYDPPPFVSSLSYLPVGSNQGTANVKFTALGASQTGRTSFTANWFVETSNVSSYDVYLWFSDTGWQLVTPVTTDGGISSRTITGLSPDTTYTYYIYATAIVNGQSIGTGTSQTIEITTHPDAYTITSDETDVPGMYEYSGTYNGKPKYKKYDAYNYFLGYYKEKPSCDQSIGDDCEYQHWALLIDGSYDVKYSMHKSTIGLELPLESYTDSFGDPTCVWNGAPCYSNLALSRTRLTPPAPGNLAATNMQTTHFTANWNAVANTTGYELDVATDSSFNNYVSGYTGKVIANGNTYDTVTGLTPNTVYYFRARAYYQGQVTRFESLNSSTTAATTWAASSVTTQSVTGIGTTTATGNGSITNLGNPYPTQHGIVWDTYSNPTIALNSKTESGSANSTGPFTGAMVSLSPYTFYYVRSYVTNAVGTTYGNAVTFRTGAVAPAISTQAVSSITDTAATGNGNITNLGIPNPTQHGIVWDTAPNPTISLNTKTESGPASVTGPFAGSITGLSPNTLYHVRAYATSAAGTVYGGEVSFISDGTAATVTTQAVTDITTTSATGHGAISLLSIPNPTQHGIVWSTSSSPTVDLITKTESGPATATGPFSDTLAGLDPATTYYVRAYATNTVGTSYGNEVLFTTAGIVPIVTTQAVNNITTTTATGNGSILNTGAPDPVQHGIVWNTSTLPTVDLNTKTENGSVGANGPFTGAMAGLSPYTIYYVRAYATNTAGTAYGAQVSFTTTGIAPTVTTQAVSDITAGTGTATGNVAGLGVPNPTQHGVVWDVFTNPTVSMNTKTENGPTAVIGPFTGAMTGLLPDTTYYVRAYATNPAATVYGVQVTFTTLGLVPTVTTPGVVDITSTTATGSGAITNLGVPNPTQHGLVWNTSINPVIDLSTKTENGPVSAVGTFTDTLSGLTPNTFYYVRAYAINSAGIVYGNTESFSTLGEAPVISVHPASIMRLSGQTVIFSVTAAGTEPLAYQWRKNGLDLPGANSSQYEIPSVESSDAGQYACAVSNAIGSVTSNTATLTISAIVEAYNVTGAGYAGANGSYFDSGRTYNGKPVYEQTGYIMGYRVCPYDSNSWVILNSSEDSALERGGGFPLYRNGTDQDTPPASAWTAVHLAVDFVGVPFVTRVLPPEIVGQPQSLSTQLNATATFSVTATGSAPLSYQWQKDGIDINGGTDATLFVAPVTEQDEGAYACKVSNRAGTVSSDPAHLFIGETLTILIQPESQAANPGESVTFSISAFGTEPLFYQWQKDGVDIAGADENVYAIAAVIESDVGGYTCVVSNAFGSVGSATASLTVLGPASIQIQPDSQIRYLNQSVTFSVKASGTQPIDYQWLKDGSVISGATSATFTIGYLALSDAGDYTCNVDNDLGQDESDPATLEVYFNDAPTITGQVPDPLTTARGMAFAILMAHLAVEDANDIYPDGFVLNIMPGDGYTVEGHVVTPLEDFEGDELLVPVSVNDGNDDSNVYMFLAAINDAEPVAAVINDRPARVTNAENYVLTIGGKKVAAYKYQLDDGAWSQPVDVAVPLEFSLDEGPHTLEVVGCDTAGRWQSQNRTTRIQWTIDTTPPAAVLNNAPVGTVGASVINAMVSGLDVRYFRYRLDGGAWETVLPVNQTLVISDLEEGGHTLEVIGMDMAGNWESAPTVDGTATWVIDITVPTAIMSNLPDAITNAMLESVIVGYEEGAPAVDQYKYSLDNGITWQLGQGPSIDLVAGVLQEGINTILVNAYNQALDRWQDDDVGESTVNATRYSWRIDTTSPVAPSLSADYAFPASTAVSLFWSATEDGLRSYQLYVADVAFDAVSMDIDDSYYVGLHPGAEGLTASYIAEGLSPGTTFYFGVTSEDQAGNLSPLSNIATYTTADDLPRIMTARLADGGSAADNTVARSLFIAGENFIPGDSNMIRFSCPPRIFEAQGVAASSDRMTVEVPCGTPVGIYRLKVINTNGTSPDCADTYTIMPASMQLPEILHVRPSTIAGDMATSVVITGNNFIVRDTKAESLTLIHSSGQSFSLDVFDVQHTQKIAAMVPAGVLPQGQYTIRVSTINGSNDVSTANLEVVDPVDLSVAGTANLMTTQGIDMSHLGIGETTQGILPVAVALKTPSCDDNQMLVMGEVDIEAEFAPGTHIYYDDGASPSQNYDGVFNPPRQISISSDLAELISRPSSAVVFQMGSTHPLKLGEGQTVFLRIKMALPDTAVPPLVYTLTSQGDIQLAGVDGQWQGYAIEKGGTRLDERQGQPEAGYTRYTLGVLLDHFSTFVIGTSKTDDTSSTNQPFSVGVDSDGSGGCFIESARER